MIPSSPLITILINNYNYEKYLGEAIDSALAQTYSRVEVVVVDDGSSDRSREIMQAYGDKIHAVFKENGGQASAINAGFQQSTGDIIMTLDSDDYLEPFACERIVANWSPDFEMLFHRLRQVRNGKKLESYLPHRRLAMVSGDMVPQLLSQGRYVCPPTSGLSFSRKLMQAIMPIPESEYRICADNYLRLHGAFLGRVRALEETLVYYRVHSFNNFDAGTPRRLLTRPKLKERQRHRNQSYNLLKQIAEARHLSLASQNSSYRARDIFEEMMLVAGDPGASLGSRLRMAWKTICKIGREAEYGWYHRFREMAQVFLLVVGPRILLKKIYPGLYVAE